MFFVRCRRFSVRSQRTGASEFLTNLAALRRRGLRAAGLASQVRKRSRIGSRIFKDRYFLRIIFFQGIPCFRLLRKLLRYSCYFLALPQKVTKKVYRGAPNAECAASPPQTADFSFLAHLRCANSRQTQAVCGRRGTAALQDAFSAMRISILLLPFLRETSRYNSALWRARFALSNPAPGKRRGDPREKTSRVRRPLDPQGLKGRKSLVLGDRKDFSAGRDPDRLFWLLFCIAQKSNK